MIQTLESGRDAVARHDWAEATETLAAVDRDGGLSPEDLDLLGTAYWWTGRPDEAESGVHAWLGVFRSLGELMGQRLDEGIAEAGRAMAIARRHGNADALYLAMSF